MSDGKGIRLWTRWIRLRTWPLIKRIPRFSRALAGRIRDYTSAILHRFTTEDVPLWTGAIAFKVLIALVPLALLITGVFGLLLRQDNPFTAVSESVNAFLPDFQSAKILELLGSLAGAGGTITTIAAIGLMVTAISLFSTLHAVIANIFEERHQPRWLIWSYLFDLRMAIQSGLLFVLTFGLTLALANVQSAGVEAIGWLGIRNGWMIEGWYQVNRFFLVLLPPLITTTMFFQLFWFTPNPRPPLKSAIFGAVIGGLLWEVAKTAFTFYVLTFDPFAKYSELGSSSIAPLGDFFGVLVALVFWVYYSSIVIVIGGMVTVIHEKRRVTISGLED